MQTEITYIFHNCFILKIEGLTFLFDYPADKYLTAEMRQLVKKEIKDTRLFVLASHGHQDHFHPQLSELANLNPATTLILSDDIAVSQPRLKMPPNTLLVGADQSYQCNGFELETFKSNDLGVAFLIKLNGRRIYFGGDLANWNWEEFSISERQAMTEHFQQSLDKLAQHPLDLAFSNTDQRLPNWAGAGEFIQALKPRLFVPMHTFGDTGSLQRFQNELGETPTKVFYYQKPGDNLKIKL